jgi:hypothetical protein
MEKERDVLRLEAEQLRGQFNNEQSHEHVGRKYSFTIFHLGTSVTVSTEQGVVFAQEPVWMLLAISVPNAPPWLLPAELAGLLPVTSACSALSAHYMYVTTNSSITITIIAACINF